MTEEVTRVYQSDEDKREVWLVCVTCATSASSTRKKSKTGEGREVGKRQAASVSEDRHNKLPQAGWL